jgi:hypothetical protein
MCFRTVPPQQQPPPSTIRFTVARSLSTKLLPSKQDDPESPFYIARTTAINATNISVHYYGCKTPILDRAVFRPGWHAPESNLVTLAATCPPGNVPCTGNLKLDSPRELLIARNLEFAKGSRLKKKSQRAITPKLADLFIF